MPSTFETIVILDFGSQYTQLIARRIRESNVYCEIHPYNYPIEKLQAINPKGIILSGGPASVYEEDAPKCSPEVLKLGVPVLGICYGFHLVAEYLGGTVSPSAFREYGSAVIQVVDATSQLFAGLNSE